MVELECLRHLRELRADHNNIMNIEGIQDMDCLIKLSLIGNKIQRLNLEKVKWYVHQHVDFVADILIGQNCKPSTSLETGYRSSHISSAYQ